MKAFFVEPHEMLAMKIVDSLHDTIEDMLVCATISKARLMGDIGMSAEDADEIITSVWKRVSEHVESQEETAIARKFFDGKITYKQFEEGIKGGK